MSVAAADENLIESLVADCVLQFENASGDIESVLARVAPEAAAEVRDRLEGLRQAGLLPDPEADAVEPEALGPYRVLRRLGSGGMGAVYLGEREDGLARRVAVKVVKRGMDTREILTRFRLERQTLAKMQHPSIAQVLDAGETEDGRSFFAMEYVDGVPITTWCDRERVGLPRRIELFCDVLQAITHAHQKGVLHRDLKPSNVLVAVVDGQPRVKVIDFGVAKVLDVGGGHVTLTRAGHVVGTPAYMSPEQAREAGADVDVRSDVYSAGVLLYELLVGALPIDAEKLRSKSWTEIERVLADIDPPRPSQRVAIEGETEADDGRWSARSETRDGLIGTLRGDLDWVCMKALAKRPSDRYPSAAEFEADLRRHREGLPVDAAPPSWRYRARRFVARHRVGVTLTAAVFVTGLIGAVGTTLALGEARRNAAEATATLVWVMADVRGIDLPAIEKMIEKRIVDLEEYRAENGVRDAEVERLLALLWMRFSRLLFDHHDVGRAHAASKNAFDAIARAEDVGGPQPPIVAVRAAIHRCAYDLWFHEKQFGEGEVVDQEERAEVARAHLLQSLMDCREVVRNLPSPGARLRVIGALLTVFDSDKVVGESADLMGARLDEAAAHLDDYHGRDDQALLYRSRIAGKRGSLAQLRGDPKEAEACYRRASASLRELLDRNPDHANYERMFIEQHMLLAGSLATQSRMEESSAIGRDGLARARRMAKRYPRDYKLRRMQVFMSRCMLWNFEHGAEPQPGEVEAIEAELERFGGELR